MPKHKRGIIPNRYSLVHQTNISSKQSTPTENKETLNILNGVLNCAWDKTSYSPKLLEIYGNSQVKLNIDSHNPLVLAFANGWDDLDRPAQIVKRLTVAPPNIDLSGKANCKVQIVAKVVNDELVITTHDILDSGLGYGTNIIPSFASGRGGTDAEPTKDGWTIRASSYSSSYYPWRARDGNGGTASVSWGSASSTITEWIEFIAPCRTMLSAFRWWAYNGQSGAVFTLKAYDYTTLDYVSIADSFTEPESTSWQATRPITNPICSDKFRVFVVRSGSYSKYLSEIEFFEYPTATYHRTTNIVKDRSGNDSYWVNLGLATIDAAGSITALDHYTHLNNNYPGGMRVEA